MGRWVSPVLAIRGRPKANEQQISFAGGLNTTADDTQVAADEMRQTNNSRLTEFGGVTKRGGSQNLHASPIGAGNPVRGGLAWLRASGQQLMAISNGTLYTASYGIPTTWTSRGGTFTASVYPSFAPFRNGSGEAAYIADGGVLNSWDGTTLTMRIAGAATISRIAVYNQRLFGVTGVDENLFYSPLNDGDGLGNGGAGGGQAVVRTFGDQAIVSLVTMKSSLLMFHVSGISRFTGISMDDIAIQAGATGITSDVGTIAPMSVVSTENAAYCLTDRGFYEVTEYGVTPISQKIDATVRAFDFSNANRLLCAHNRFRREIWWYMPDMGIYCYNYFLKSWSGPFDGGFISPVTHSLFEAVDSDSTPIVLAGTSEGLVKQADVPGIYRDNVLSDGTSGTRFSMVVRPHRFYLGDLIDSKALRYLYAVTDLAGSQNTAVSWTIGGTTRSSQLPASTSQYWGAGMWGSGLWGSSTDTEYRVQGDGVGRYLDLTFTDSGEANVVLSALRAEAFNYGPRF